MNTSIPENYYESLFLRLLAGDIQPEEYKALEKWFDESEDNRKALTDLYLASYAIDSAHTMKNIDSLGALNRVNRTLRTHRKRRIRRLAGVSAACLALIATATLWLTREHNPVSVLSFDKIEKPAAAGGEVSLILSDNEVVKLEGDAPAVEYDADGRLTSGAKIIESSPTHQDVTFHQLIVPKGKRSTVTLPDGTLAWINADSRLVFPSSFGASREVMVEGEVYLDVAKDPSKPFIVRTKNFNVNVLGTAFNICAYEEDDHQSIMLVRGTVSVTAGKDKTPLEPNQMLTYTDGKILVKAVDPEDHASWIRGVYRFRSEQLKDIGERLARYYGKEVRIENADVGSIRCSGKLELNDTPDKVYESLAEAAMVEYLDHGSYVEFRARGIQ